MRILSLSLSFALAAISCAAVDVQSLKSAFAAKVEQIATRMLPQEKFNRALGFFGPVTKKYLPVFHEFNAEYLAGTNRLATVRKYLPQAQAALAEAKAMKVPPKYEAEKADYLRMTEAFLKVVTLTVRLGE